MKQVKVILPYFTGGTQLSVGDVLTRDNTRYSTKVDGVIVPLSKSFVERNPSIFRVIEEPLLKEEFPSGKRLWVYDFRTGSVYSFKPTDTSTKAVYCKYFMRSTNAAEFAIKRFLKDNKTPINVGDIVTYQNKGAIVEGLLWDNGRVRVSLEGRKDTVYPEDIIISNDGLCWKLLTHKATSTEVYGALCVRDSVTNSEQFTVINTITPKLVTLPTHHLANFTTDSIKDVLHLDKVLTQIVKERYLEKSTTCLDSGILMFINKDAFVVFSLLRDRIMLTNPASNKVITIFNNGLWA